MRALTIFLSIFLIFSQYYCNGSLSLYSDLDVKNYAHGYWKAVDGDINVNNVEPIVFYNWYAIDTRSGSDSISVTWDNGRDCTKSPAIMIGNLIVFSANGYNVKIEINMNKKANAYFNSSTKSYQKTLTKLRDDPNVLCI